MLSEPSERVVEGEVERITYENATTSFRVLRLHVDGGAERLTVAGAFPPVPAGARVRVRGTMGNDARYGEQLKAVSVTELAPTTLVGIEKYLGSGLIHGIGEGLAKRIVKTFGMETLKVLDEAPERLREVGGLGERRIEAVVHAWSEQRSVRDVMVFLQAHGASPALATRIFRRYGARSAELVAREPYRLAIEVWGVGFRTADRIAREVGIAADAPERVEAAVLQAARDVVDEGHVYADEGSLLEHASGLVGSDEPLSEGDLRAATARLTAMGHVVVETLEHERAIYPSALFHAEVRLAKRLAEVAGGAARPLSGVDEVVRGFEGRSGVTLADEQRDAVRLAAASNVIVITGGPGVGKTTVVRALLDLFVRAKLDVRLAAPTGRAARRMSEATGREATTLHRLLDFEPKGARFRRDAGCPVEADALIVDEASMIDLPLADALTQAVAPGTRLVIVGDVDQLPSVGPGNVLGDLIAARVIPAVRLTRIFRQARESLIVANAHRINDGERPLAPDAGEGLRDFYVMVTKTPKEAQDVIVGLVTERIPQRFGLDPLREVQVLTPQHRGDAGTDALNEALQRALNPNGDAVVRAGKALRVGDKVMQLRNDYERGVFNGDMGIVARIDGAERRVFVAFDDRGAGSDAPPERIVTYEPSGLDDLTLAYACSIHKSQGSEYPAVVVPMLTSHFVMLSRNLLYTAVTRAKRLCVLVVNPRAIDIALSRVRELERRTGLVARLGARFAGR